MYSFSEVIEALNEVKGRGIVSHYAIAGAMAVTFWAEPIATFDLDVLVLLPDAGSDSPITSLTPIYDWAAAHGYDTVAQHIVIKDVPVQFVPAYNALAEEAVREARTLDYRGVPVSVVRPEYLIAPALDPEAKSARRRERAAMLAELAIVEPSLLADVMARYHLSW